MSAVYAAVGALGSGANEADDDGEAVAAVAAAAPFDDAPNDGDDDGELEAN